MVHNKIIFSLTTLAVCFMSALLLIYETAASDAIRNSLALFIDKVLPPLFPFMVMSKVIVSLDLLSPLCRAVKLNRVFGLPLSASPVIFTGLLCGFPIGASGTCTLYECGRISVKDAGRLAALSSNTSPAFIIGTVAALWSSKKYGLFLYTVQTISAVAIAFVFGLFDRNREGEAGQLMESGECEKKSFAGELCRAVSESASSCLAICAYIVFFRVAAVLCASLIPQLEWIFSILFEFSSGCANGALLGGGMGICMTGFAVGFAGFSVMMQNYNFLGKHMIPVSTLIITKILQGFICAGASLLFYWLSPVESVGTAEVSQAFGECFSLNAVVIVLFSLAVLSKIYNISRRVI